MRPTLRATLLFLAALPVSLVPVLVWAELWTIWLAYLGTIALACGADALLGVQRRRLALASEAPPLLYIGDDDPEPLALTLEVTSRRGAARVEVLAETGEILAQPPPDVAEVAAKRPATVNVPLVALRRGTARVPAVHLRWSGPFGLMRRQTRVAVGRQVPVVPNTRAVRAMAVRYLSSKEFLAGLKVERYLGDGSEFESLREYVPGMDHRAIDWKASARHLKLLCQEFRAERNHQIIIAVDTGHLMSEPLGGVPRMDHAINAALLLGYVGLKTGDRVGLYGFDEKVRGFTEPQGGVAAFPRLQAASAELDYGHAETNFTLGLAELSLRLRRRSLVVLLTDFVDTVTAELMIENLDRLARRHLVVFVTLRDPGLDSVVAAAPKSSQDVYRSVVAHDLVRERDLVLRRLRRLGIAAIDSPPAGVSAQLLNRYLEIKRREMI